MIIELATWEYEHASNVGIRRWTANWLKNDAAHYDRTLMEDDRTATVAAAICELAVAKHTNEYWHGHVWHCSEHNRYKHMPDVGFNIEVRRIRTSNSVPVRSNALGRGLVLWACKPTYPEFRTVEIYGWIDHDTAWSEGFPSTYAPETTRLFPLEKMNNP
jgi:hypothetical protein